MSTNRPFGPAVRLGAAALLLAAAAFSMPAAHAQQPGQIGFIAQPVGGVFVDAHGVVANAHVDSLGELERLRARLMQEQPGELAEFTPLRKVSLRRLEAAIEAYLAEGKPLPEEVQYLAGLQGIRYVLVYPEQNDIVLAGPAEGWRVDGSGALVGLTTGEPVLQLDDLLVALRSAQGARETGISCSIDPTPEGIQQLQSFLRQQRTIGDNPQATLRQIEQALGPQVVSVTGVPANSHFARVLVAADYRMKRLAMYFEPAPVSNLPSFLQMAAARQSNMMPRWWLAPNYDALLRDADGLTWEVPTASVQALTEDSFFAASGNRQQSGKANPIAQKWADLMTEHYDELAAKLPIFAELRNLMDLAVVSALIVKERLPERAGYSMSVLTSPTAVEVAEFHAPRRIDTQASFVKKGRNYIISASGGVDINSWAHADQVEEQPALAPLREEQAAPASTERWWWN